MAIEEVISKFSLEQKEKIGTVLIDIILKSKKAIELCSGDARRLLRFWQEDKLYTDEGLSFLLELARKLEPEKTIEKLSSKGFSGLAKILGEG